MPFPLSTMNRWALALFWLAFASHAAIKASFIRPAGAPLDPSVQNEADHAVNQACLWLAAHQRADGAWGENAASARLTSLALLALAAADRRDQSDARARALVWLDSHATNRIDDLEVHAWRLIAFVRLLPDSPARTNVLARYAAQAQPFVARAPADAQRLWREAQTAAALAPATPSADAGDARDLARAAQTWPPDTATNAELWRLARRINALPNGQLLRDGTTLDWRRDVAQILINAQRSDPAGGGFWDADSTERRIEASAFGLLTLLEL